MAVRARLGQQTRHSPSYQMVYLACARRIKRTRPSNSGHHQQHENKLQYVHFDACDSRPTQDYNGNRLSAVLFSTLAELAPTPPESHRQQRLEYPPDERDWEPSAY
jgi:hypothetical protein